MAIDTSFGLPRAVRRNLLFDASAAVGAGLAIGVVTQLLPSVLRREGVEPVGLALLTAAPFVANTLTVFTGRISASAPWQVATARVIGCAALLLAPFVALQLVWGAAFLYWLGAAVSTPHLHRIWGYIYPPRQRGRLVGAVRTAQSAASAAAAIVGGVVADVAGGLPVVAGAGLLGGLFSAAYAFVRAPTDAPAPRYSPLESIRGLLRHPLMGPLVWAQGVWGIGATATQTLLALVMVDRLGLPLTTIGMLGIVQAGSTTFSYVGWGYLADRIGGARVCAIGAVCGLSVPFGFAFAPDVTLLWLVAILNGLAASALDIGLTNSLSEAVGPDQRATHMAGWSSLTGVRGMLAPLAMGAAVQAGLLSVFQALLVCGAITALGVGMFVRLVQRQPQPRRVRIMARPGQVSIR